NLQLLLERLDVDAERAAHAANVDVDHLGLLAVVERDRVRAATSLRHPVRRAALRRRHRRTEVAERAYEIACPNRQAQPGERPRPRASAATGPAPNGHRWSRRMFPRLSRSRRPATPRYLGGATQAARSHSARERAPPGASRARASRCCPA